MLDEEEIKILEKAIKKYGEKAQVYQSIEEMAELIVELNKNITRGKENIDDIAEELADTAIMLVQLEIIYSKKDKEFGSKVNSVIDYKIKRLEERLGE